MVCGLNVNGDGKMLVPRDLILKVNLIANLIRKILVWRMDYNVLGFVARVNVEGYFNYFKHGFLVCGFNLNLLIV